MKKLIPIIVLLIIGFGLNVTNPTKNDFVDFASKQIKKNYPNLDFKTDEKSSGIERMIAGFGNMLITNYLNESTTRRDYLVFSLYEVDMKLARDFGVKAKNMKVLGIGGNFVPLTTD